MRVAKFAFSCDRKLRSQTRVVLGGTQGNRSLYNRLYGSFAAIQKQPKEPQINFTYVVQPYPLFRRLPPKLTSLLRMDTGAFLCGRDTRKSCSGFITSSRSAQVDAGSISSIRYDKCPHLSAGGVEGPKLWNIRSILPTALATTTGATDATSNA